MERAARQFHLIAEYFAAAGGDARGLGDGGAALLPNLDRAEVSGVLHTGGAIPLLATQVLNEEDIRPNLPEFHKRVEWFLANRRDLIKRVAEIEIQGKEPRRSLVRPATPTRASTP